MSPIVQQEGRREPFGASGREVKRVLLLFPATTYRAEDFLTAAARLMVEVVVGVDEGSTLRGLQPHRLLTLPFDDMAAASRAVLDFTRHYPIDAVVGVDEETTVVAAALAAQLGLTHISLESAAATWDKYQLRQHLSAAGVPVPRFQRLRLDSDPHDVAHSISYPCVLKPLFLSASRGVIRADTPTEFVRAFIRIRRILSEPSVRRRGQALAQYLLVEDYIPGGEVAVEGLMVAGELHVLALFDKPDPLEGPYFEETIYVTPSRLPTLSQQAIIQCTQRACAALGLNEGPIHAELRINAAGPWVIEVAARTIGGLCSRTLRFGLGLTLEELVLRHALRLPIPTYERRSGASGVMMIPVPRRGILRDVSGLAEASNVPGIEGVTITLHRGEEVIPLPEGSRYLGFIFARAETPESVQGALREAHRCLTFVIEDAPAHNGSDQYPRCEQP